MQQYATKMAAGQGTEVKKKIKKKYGQSFQ